MQTDSYGQRLANFDWTAFYQHWFGGSYLDHIREELRSNYDYILIDSRTGESDIGGICTIQLPTILTVVFTSSPQSTKGIEKVISSIQRQYREIRNGAELPILPLPSRIDRTVEDESYRNWFQNLVHGRLGGLMEELVGYGNVEDRFNEIMTLYFPWYTFNDTLESERENINETAANASRYHNLANLFEYIRDVTIRRSGDLGIVEADVPSTIFIDSTTDMSQLVVKPDNLKNQINDNFLNNSNKVTNVPLSKAENIRFVQRVSLLKERDKTNEEGSVFDQIDEPDESRQYIEKR